MTQTIFPSLRYRDPEAAIAWLSTAFGMQEHEVARSPDGAIQHAELTFGTGVIMLGPDRDDVYGSHAGRGWLYIAVDDPDTLHERAVAAGAEVVHGLVDTDYGSRDFSVRDPEGNLWSFGTYRPETAAR
ncbi:MAG TPA: VOC family protein [Gaiellaceae bacterium]|jgi:uncharacterized glyoxalase superfamily protein PhnB